MQVQACMQQVLCSLATACSRRPARTAHKLWRFGANSFPNHESNFKPLCTLSSTRESLPAQAALSTCSLSRSVQSICLAFLGKEDIFRPSCFHLSFDPLSLLFRDFSSSLWFLNNWCKIDNLILPLLAYYSCNGLRCAADSVSALAQSQCWSWLSEVCLSCLYFSYHNNFYNFVRVVYMYKV